MVQRKSLIEDIKAWSGTYYLSDLRYLTSTQCRTIVSNLKLTDENDYTLDQWNDALTYLTASPKAKTPNQAKSEIIAYLLESVY